MISNFLTFHHKFSYIWWAVRIFAILSTPIFLVEFEFLLLVQGFALFHAYSGLINVVKDYIHNTFLQSLFLLMLRISIVELTRLIIDLCQ